ncbi:hypothetical protein [Saccharibacillus alkalitolerans]|uniref:HTH cro/C1-type domain-containing protein n=1 Tax=Saccharibacillus alkalitolerans TaxID=2705290 RepID=A0ABX0EZD5_9BACL|nr:hypothetical protein [Saccharibacillus alkalitolerans]NGZ74106.1 hypothetical protein [Saccharibacillus alkalitolerans]
MAIEDLRAFLRQEIRQRHEHLSAFAQEAGLNRGVLSNVLREQASKPLSFSLFRKIIQVLQCEERAAFKYYIEECFYYGKPSRSRLEPFLVRCGELGFTEYIEETWSRCKDADIDLCEIAFSAAEKLYAEKFVQPSILFYEYCTEHEKHIQSERLAVSHYRLFRIGVNEQNESNLIAATKFVPFYDKLPHHHQLDAAMKLINVYFALNDVKEAENWTERLSSLAHFLYDQAESANWEESPEGMEYPFVVYYGYSYLARESLLFISKRYAESKPYNEKYADLSEFPHLDDRAMKEVEKFKFYANLNAVYRELGLGNENMLFECVKLIEENPDEILVVFSFILQFALTHNQDIDELLERFDRKMEDYAYRQFGSDKNPALLLNRYVDICIDIALYYFNRGNYEKAIGHAKRGIEAPIGIGSGKYVFTRLAPIFEKFPEIFNRI